MVAVHSNTERMIPVQRFRVQVKRLKGLEA